MLRLPGSRGEVSVTGETTAFANAMIFDGVSAELREGCVRVTAGTITEISEGPEPGDRVIDCHGRVVVPGLIDAHLHAYGSRLSLLEIETSPLSYLALFCGAALSQTGGHGDPRPPELGCCLGGGHMAEEIRVVAEGAARRGSYVAAHAYSPDAIGVAVANGVRSIEHGNLLDAPTAALMAERGAFLVPTLVTYDAMERRGAELGLAPVAQAENREVLDAGRTAIGLAREAGVRIGPGAAADLLVLDGDPLRDPSVLWGGPDRRAVFQGGTRVAEHDARLALLPRTGSPQWQIVITEAARRGPCGSPGPRPRTGPSCRQRSRACGRTPARGGWDRRPTARPAPRGR